MVAQGIGHEQDYDGSGSAASSAAESRSAAACAPAASTALPPLARRHAKKASSRARPPALCRAFDRFVESHVVPTEGPRRISTCLPMSHAAPPPSFCGSRALMAHAARRPQDRCDGDVALVHPTPSSGPHAGPGPRCAAAPPSRPSYVSAVHVNRAVRPELSRQNGGEWSVHVHNRLAVRRCRQCQEGSILREVWVSVCVCKGINSSVCARACVRACVSECNCACLLAYAYLLVCACVRACVLAFSCTCIGLHVCFITAFVCVCLFAFLIIRLCSRAHANFRA